MIALTELGAWRARKRQSRTTKGNSGRIGYSYIESQFDSMVKTYSRRLLSPYTSQVQIAETDDARALSLDGSNWEVQFRVAGGDHPMAATGDQPVYQYVRVASITDARVVRRPLHPFLNAEAVTMAVDRLAARVTHASLPYAAIDRYEYWLLDATEQKPLALLHSCVQGNEMPASPTRPAWLAMPAAQLEIEDPESDPEHYVAPVNYRLQKLVEQRAGHRPHAAWFDRDAANDENFPPCLVSESWEQEDDYQLCQRYIRRLAPRLLMLQDLARDQRERLEQAARENALDVDRFHALYPDVVDAKLIKALRVEANMRRAADPIKRGPH